MKKTLIILINVLFVIYNLSSQEQKSDDLLLKALVKFEQKRYIDAQNILTEAIVKNDKNYILFLNRGENFYSQERYKNAISDFKIAEKQKKGSANYFIAKSYAQINNISKTIEYLKLYLKSKNKLLEAEIRLDPAFSKVENTKEWITLWKEKHYSNYEKNLSNAKYCISSDKISDAFDILDSEIKKNKTRHQAFYMRAILNIEIKDYKKALKDLNKVVKLKQKNTKYLIKRAETFSKLEQYKNTIDDYNSAINLNPNNPKLFYYKSKSENKIGKYKEALNSINRFLKYYPSDTEALFLCGNINYNSENYFKALEKFNECIKNGVSKPEYFNARGDCYFKTKTFEYAVKDYSMSLDLNPRSGEIYFKKGKAEYEIRNYENACHDWKMSETLKFYKASDYIQKYCKD